jgi:hypothetical protein
MARLAIFQVNVGAEAVLRHGYQREERAAERKEQRTTIRTGFFIHRRDGRARQLSSDSVLRLREKARAEFVWGKRQ